MVITRGLGHIPGAFSLLCFLEQTVPLESWRTLHPAVGWAGWYPQEDATPWEKTLFAHPVPSDTSLRNEGLVL